MAAKNGQNMNIFHIVSVVTTTLTNIDYINENKKHAKYTYKHFMFSKYIKNVLLKPDKSNMAAKILSKMELQFFSLRG